MSQDIADAAAGPTLAILFFIGFCIVYAFMVPRTLKDNEMTRYILQTTLLFIGIIIQLGINWQTIQKPIKNKIASVGPAAASAIS